MSLEEFMKDIFRMPDPQWFADRWGIIISEWKKKADTVDYIVGLENIHDGKPVTVKGWGSVGFSSAKDFGFVRLMSQLKQASSERLVAHEKLEAIKAWRKRQSLFTKGQEEFEKIINFNGLDILRWNLYPEEFPRDPLFPTCSESETK